MRCPPATAKAGDEADWRRPPNFAEPYRLGGPGWVPEAGEPSRAKPLHWRFVDTFVLPVA